MSLFNGTVSAPTCCNGNFSTSLNHKKRDKNRISDEIVLGRLIKNWFGQAREKRRRCGAE